MTTPLRIIIGAAGSAGDVLPFVKIGKTLQARGHEIIFLTNGHFRPDCERAGFSEFVEIGTDAEYQKVILNPDLWHPRKAFPIVAAFGITPHLRGSVAAIESRVIPGRTVVVASSLAMGARVLQDRTGVPTVSVHLQPGIIRSRERFMRIPGGGFQPAWLPRFVWPAVWWIVDRIIDPHVAPAINQLRAEHGQPPISRVLKSWFSSPLCTIGLFPEWYYPRPSDWPPHVIATGFPVSDGDAGDPLDPALEQFLQAGDPPIVFTPGSAMALGRKFFRVATEASVKLGRRALLLTRAADQLPDPLPDGVMHVPWVPFSRVLSRAAAFVHHGGIGSLSQGMQAGVPQLLMPMAHDQYDNAHIAGQLGVAEAIPEPRWRTDRVVVALQRLLQPAAKARCAAVAQNFVGHDPIGDTCDLIERAAASPAGAS
ncbi:MAG: glycosyltransferase [Planctomycetota bacterium]